MQSARSGSPRGHRARIATLRDRNSSRRLVPLARAGGARDAAGTLERVRQAGKLTLGYRSRRAAIFLSGRVRQPDRLFRRRVPEDRRAGEDAARALHAGRGVDGGHARGSLPRRAGGQDRPAVRSGQRFAVANEGSVVLDPDLPGRDRGASACGFSSRAAGRPGAKAAVGTVLACAPGADPGGQDLLGHHWYDERALAGGSDRQVPAHREGRSCRGLRCWRAAGAGPQHRRLLRRARHPSGHRQAQPVGARSDRSRSPVHVRADRPRIRSRR